MARASNSTQCESVATYMDGVHVKIAEAYKPPRKIALPAAYNNRLPDASRYCYDFTLERSVLQKMSEWRKARLSNSEAREARLEEKRKKEEESPTPPGENSAQLPIKGAPVPETTILTPQLLSPPPYHSQNCNIQSNQLNYADFDNDTSSPFDNMLLKTINDKEELAQVLQPNWEEQPSGKLENIINHLSLERQDNRLPEKDDSGGNRGEEQERGESRIDCKQRIVSLIVKELQRELERPILENWKPWSDLDNSPEKNSLNCDNKLATPTQTKSNIFSELSDEDQKLARHLSDMGFPLGRAARAIQNLGGGDNKKIVEYLLAIQSLEDDFGIPEDAAEKALELTHFDQEKAKNFHKNLCTLRDLGFSEDQASTALLKCNIDRDKALDLLIS
ncbi:ubiquitin-associated protein 1 [Belonocnema kinseyi]|uniref:ubiquitin-associated protein 1 n=1 Tax=Belonocnema kinseyi TaxID=2817044 RepID=UPI00143D2544|nr:ubiquitin-associated protein 1 [Belonocnema kinseyi]